MNVRMPPSGVRSTVKVEIDIFSGRENPSWELSPAESSELVERIHPLVPIAPSAEENGLGYRGFVILNPEGKAELPAEIRVYNRALSITSGGHTRYYEDVNGVERWLFQAAQRSGYGDLIDEAIR